MIERTARLVLASASPRRRDLLARLDLPFEIFDPRVDEGGPTGRPERIARRLATAKARAGAARYSEATVLAADTLVAYHNIVLGKPGDADEARAMLGLLRGRTHRVITAVAVLPPGRRRPLIDHAVTSVTMRRYSDDEIAASITRGDPFDKAGGYAIQDQRLAPVARYDALPQAGQSPPADTRGCYCNVIGLPLGMTVRLLGRAGLDITGMAVADLLPQCRECGLAPVDWR